MELTVNGQTRQVEIEPDTPLLWVIREDLGLTGTKYGCGVGMCGACTVLVDGVATRSCQMPLEAVEGAQITTIEAVEDDQTGARVVAAWIANNVPQCGYCQSGQVLAATALLKETPNPTEDDIAGAMSNLCRCGTYNAIAAAVRDASKA